MQPIIIPDRGPLSNVNSCSFLLEISAKNWLDEFFVGSTEEISLFIVGDNVTERELGDSVDGSFVGTFVDSPLVGIFVDSGFVGRFENKEVDGAMVVGVMADGTTDEIV